MEYREKLRVFLLNQILVGPGMPKAVRDDEPLVSSGLVDSLSIVEIMGFVEKTFGLDVGRGEIDINDFDTVDSICRLLERSRANISSV
jgi:acyl carrier protein